MIIGSIKEQNADETRVALVPSVVKRLTAGGFTVLLENGFGQKAGFTDKEYISAGANIRSTPGEIYAESLLLLQIRPPSADFLAMLTPKQLIAADFRNAELSELPQNITILRLERVPRTSVAQSIDILSAQNTVRGYVAALYALAHSSRIAPQLMTAAASLKAASALVIGAGVTGLQAASVFKRQGCRVTILDISPHAEELAKSVGAGFSMAQSRDELAALLNGKSFILAAAAAPDGNSPQIISKDLLPSLQSGTVIVDTTENNVEIQENRKTTAAYRFYRNPLAERLMPLTASELWANNMYNLISTIAAPGDSFSLNADYIVPMLDQSLPTARSDSGKDARRASPQIQTPVGISAVQTSDKTANIPAGL